VAPGHALLDATVDVVLERFQPLLQQGSVLVDDSDESTAPRLLVYLEHAIRDGRTVHSGEPRVVSQRLQFVHLTEDGAALDGGPAPYLDCRPITQEERLLVDDAITAPWLSEGVENRALGYAIATLVPEHLAEVKHRRLGEIDKVEREVRARLNREINHWDSRAARLREEERAGKEQRVGPIPQPEPGAKTADSGPGSVPPTSPAPTSNQQPRRFFGSVEVDMVRPVKAFEAILSAVVTELQRTKGAKVRITLEIEADAEEGFSEADIGVVRDNAHQLKFKAESTGFE